MATWEYLEIPGTGQHTHYVSLNRPPSVEHRDFLPAMGSYEDRFRHVKGESGFSIQYDWVFRVYCVCEQLYVVMVTGDPETALDEWQRRIGHYRAERERRLLERRGWR
jgi:hypothetical protein